MNNLEAYIVLYKGKRWKSKIFCKIGAAKGSITQAISYNKWREYKREDFEIIKLIPENKIKHYIIIENKTRIVAVFSDLLKAESNFSLLVAMNFNKQYTLEEWDGEKCQVL